MTASPPPPVPPLVRALLDVREILERARRSGDRREIEAAIERINAARTTGGGRGKLPCRVGGHSYALHRLTSPVKGGLPAR